jgi:hypothetical protein
MQPIDQICINTEASIQEGAFPLQWAIRTFAKFFRTSSLTAFYRFRWLPVAR